MAKRKQRGISLPPDLDERILNDAQTQRRTYSSMVVWIVEQHYERQREKERKDEIPATLEGD